MRQPEIIPVLDKMGFNVSAIETTSEDKLKIKSFNYATYYRFKFIKSLMEEKPGFYRD